MFSGQFRTLPMEATKTTIRGIANSKCIMVRSKAVKSSPKSSDNLEICFLLVWWKPT